MDIKESLEIDNSSRTAIVSDMDRNFFVEAGAGSGKTTMLVRRMVALVEQGVDIRKICAITFTKAAAGEFYERFQKLLIERANPHYEAGEMTPGSLPVPTAETRERCSKALEAIDLCFMGTIDSFCGMILSEHPSEAGIPADSAIIDDAEAKELYRQLFVKISKGLSAPEGKDLKALAGIFSDVNGNAAEVFAEGMAVLMNNRNAHFNYDENFVLDINGAFKSQKKELLDTLRYLQENDDLQYSGNKKSQAAWDALDSAVKSIRRSWGRNLTWVIKAMDSIRELRLVKGADSPKNAVSLNGFFEMNATKKWMEIICSAKDAKDKSKLDKLISDLKNLQYQISVAFMVRSIPLVEKELREKGKLTYFDYLYYLRNMLRKDAAEDGKLIQHIYDRHSIFLIDEFQDTNPLQAEVFFYLTSEKPVEKWQECVPRQGSLFIVGDPKQSIYRFRGADVKAFNRVEALFEKNGGKILKLTQNFRSTLKLCKYFNTQFSILMMEKTDNQSRFESIPTNKQEAKGFQGVYTYKSYTGDKAIAEHPEETDPKQLRRIVENLVGNKTCMIQDEESKKLRPLKYSDIMIISYGKGRLAPIMEEFQTNDIPVRTEGKVPFESNNGLIEAVKIYKAVADPQNEIALYGALTGSVLGASCEDIVSYKLRGGRISLFASTESLNPDGGHTKAVKEKIDRLNSLAQRAGILSPAGLFAEIIDEFKVYEHVESDNMEVLYYSLELLRDAEKSGKIVSLKDGADFLSERIAGEGAEERCLRLSTEQNCVHLANLHKVKGLEAPVVILSYSYGKTVPSADIRIDHGDESTEGYFFSLGKKDTYVKYFETAGYEDQKKAEIDDLTAEKLRLIYVAATRARNALILCDSEDSRGPNSLWKTIMADSPDFFSKAGDPSEQREDGDGQSVTAAELYEKGETAVVFNDRSKEIPSYSFATPSSIEAMSKISGSLEAEEMAGTAAVEPVVNEEHVERNVLGTMVHRIMEVLVSSGNKIDAEYIAKEVVSEYTEGMSSPDEKKVVNALKKMAKTIQNGGFPQKNNAPQDILSLLLSADEVHCEVPFSYKESEGKEAPVIWNGIMDVIYRKDGKWHIIDYKTNMDGDNLDERYKNQLEAYIKAFKEIEGEEADAMTYHIDI